MTRSSKPSFAVSKNSQFLSLSFSLSLSQSIYRFIYVCVWVLKYFFRNADISWFSARIESIIVWEINFCFSWQTDYYLPQWESDLIIFTLYSCHCYRWLLAMVLFDTNSWVINSKYLLSSINLFSRRVCWIKFLQLNAFKRKFKLEMNSIKKINK